MKKTNKIILIIVLVSLLLLGIGYAAIQNITLTISGKADVEAKQENFNVKFIDASPKENEDPNVTTKITEDTKAEINVRNLSEAGDTVFAIYTIKNESPDLSADLSIATFNSETDYLTISSQLEKISLKAGEETTVTVMVTVTKTPITDNITADIGVELVAIPVQPGKEGSSDGINDFSQTPEINKYGFYYNRFYTMQEENFGIIVHPDDSAEIFEFKTKDDYPDLEKDDWFCIDYNEPGETGHKEAFANGAKAENEGKTVIDVEGNILTLSDIVPHGYYINNRYACESTDEVATFRNNDMFNLTTYDNNGLLESDYSLEKYLKIKGNGYLVYSSGNPFCYFNVTGDMFVTPRNGNIFKINEIHNYVEQTIIEPTCFEDGKIMCVCTDCNDTYTLVDTKYNHRFDSNFDKVCDICGEEISRYFDFDVEDSVIEMIIDCDSKDTEITIPPYFYEQIFKAWLKNVRIKEDAFVDFTNLTTITIPNTITKIEAWTFENITTLTTVNYTGTKEEWESIEIGEKNTPLINATINYNYEMPIE